MTGYYVSHDGAQYGPWSLDDITGKVKSSELTLLDYIWDDEKKDWIMLMDFSPLHPRFETLKPQTSPAAAPKLTNVAPAKADKSVVDEREWYVLKGENKFGPFAYTEVLRMLQQKAIYEFDFAWYPGLETWKRIAEFNDFSPNRIRELQQTMTGIEQVFYRRRHRRVRYGGTILVHDNQTVWKGQGVEISAGGAGVLMENAMIVPGQTLYLHFKPGDGVPPFNAVCEVVSKKFEDGIRGKETPIRYGLKFLNITAATQKFLHDFAK
jgi:hypothetical protein